MSRGAVILILAGAVALSVAGERTATLAADAAGGTNDPVAEWHLDALADERGNGTAAVLGDFVNRVADERGEGGSVGGDADGGSGFPIFLVVLVVAVVGLFGLSRVRRRRREQADLEQVKAVAREDLVALGDDIRALHCR